MVAATASVAAGLWVWARRSGRPAPPPREEGTDPGAVPELAPAGRRDGARPVMLASIAMGAITGPTFAEDNHTTNIHHK